MVGHRAGEEFVIDVTFPADYTVEKLRTKTAQFEIWLNQGSSFPQSLPVAFSIHPHSKISTNVACAREAARTERQKGNQHRRTEENVCFPALLVFLDPMKETE